MKIVRSVRMKYDEGVLGEGKKLNEDMLGKIEIMRICWLRVS